MSTHDDDLDLLLSLRDRIPETPPGSPRSLLLPDASPERQYGAPDMSVFRDAVKDYLVDDPVDAGGAVAPKSGRGKGSADIEVEKFSGLRIRKCLISQTEINKHFSDVRFIRLTAIRNLLVGDTISGCWATVGVLTEKGNPRQSSTGKTFCVWKLGALDESCIPVFLFGDAYTNNINERVGTVFALFNASVRKDNGGKGFSLSIFSTGQMLKMGSSVDYGICKGKRKDGGACTMVINKRQGIYCKYHVSNTAKKYSTARTELNGGNLRTAFRPKSEGIYMFDPQKDTSNTRKSGQAVKVISFDGLKKVLSNAGKVTSHIQSQGIRFLSEVTAKLESNNSSKGSTKLKENKTRSVKRPSSIANVASLTADCKLDAKRNKTDSTEKVIELDFVSSDEER